MATSSNPLREEIASTDVPAAISHYTDAVRFGNILFVSGFTPHDEAGNLIGGDDVAAQARQVHENLKKILTQAGATFADILKVTVFLTDINDRAKINPVRQEYFGSAKPASTLVQISALALPGMKIEIEAVVGLPNRSPLGEKLGARA